MYLQNILIRHDLLAVSRMGSHVKSDYARLEMERVFRSTKIIRIHFILVLTLSAINIHIRTLSAINIRIRTLSAIDIRIRTLSAINICNHSHPHFECY